MDWVVPFGTSQERKQDLTDGQEELFIKHHQLALLDTDVGHGAKIHTEMNLLWTFFALEL